jgi:orotate phosphoribosyltransferase
VKVVVKIIREAGATVAGIGAIVDRSNGVVDFGVDFKALVSLDIKSWDETECPLCAAGVPVVKPGSRKA